MSGQSMMPSPEGAPLVIWGASEHARVVADIVRLQGTYSIVGFLDDLHPERRGDRFCGAAVLGGREQLDLLPGQGVRHILPGFGDCKMRLELTALVEARGFVLAVAVHPSAVVAQDAVLGAGTVLVAGAVVNPGARIGRSVIINTAASIDHDCVIGDAVHICPGVHLAGRVVVGQATQVGIGATVVDGVRIGAGVLIGAGAVVVRDIPDNVVAYGVPARVKRVVER